MIKKPVSNVSRLRRHTRVRKNLEGTQQRPRLNVFRSLNHIYAQIINDETKTTLAAASSLDKEIKALGYGGNRTAAKAVGKLVAKRAAEKNIKTVVFDRGGYLYHGRVKELADGAREGGLDF